MNAWALRCRSWWVASLLLLLPTLVYWPTIFHRYGFRDDYPTAREAREEPDKVVQFVATQARPLYAELLIQSFKFVRRVDDFRWIRLGSALLWGALAVALYTMLRAMRWDRVSSGLIAALVPLLPSAQVVVSWAVAWPHVLALLLVCGGFAATERAGLSIRNGESNSAETGTVARPRRSSPVQIGNGDRWVWSVVAIMLVAASALIYQPSTFFYVPLFAAAWLGGESAPAPKRVRILRVLRHGLTLGMGLGVALAVVASVFALGWLDASRRVAIESDFGGKILWFLREPFRDALALIALDDSRATPPVHHVAVGTTVVVLILGAVAHVRKSGWVHGCTWAAALLGLALCAYAVSLVSHERLNAYRTLLPVTVVVLFFFADALTRLGSRRLAWSVLGMLLVVGAILARRQTLELFARPQAGELAVVEAAVSQMRPDEETRAFAIPATMEEVPGRRRFADEFATLTADGDWAVKEMLLLLLREKFPEGAPRIRLSGGWELSEAERARYDVVIDLRERCGARAVHSASRERRE